MPPMLSCKSQHARNDVPGEAYQQPDVLPVPDTAFVPFWLRLRVPHRVSALAWAPWASAAAKAAFTAPGKLADLCAVSLGDLESRPCYDPLSHLINVTSRDNVTHVWVAGKCCVDNKTLPNDRQNDLESAVALWQNSLEFRQRP